MHCLRVFRSSVPSDLLPSSPGRRQSCAVQGECGSTRSTEWGVGPGGAVSYRRCRPAGKSPAGLIGEGMLPGPVHSQGRVARAQRAATCLETAGERWRAARARSRAGTAGRKLRRLLAQRAPGIALGCGRQSPDQARHLVGWNSGELPGQLSEQLASWPPGPSPSTDQPPADA